MPDRLVNIFKTVTVPRPSPPPFRDMRVVSYDDMVFDRFWALQFPLYHEDALAWVAEQGLDFRIHGVRIGFRNANHALAYKMRWG